MATGLKGEIEKQIVGNCYALIAVFRSGMGTPTGAAISGTSSEIETLSKASKPCALYFFVGDVGIGTIDAKQLQLLQDYKASMKTRGVYGEYSNVHDLSRQIVFKLNALCDGFVGEDPHSLVEVGRGQYQGQVLMMVSDNQIGWGRPGFTGMGPE